MTTNEMILAVIAIIGVIAFAIHILRKRTPKENAERYATYIMTTTKLKFDNKDAYLQELSKYAEFYTEAVYNELVGVINNIPDLD